MSQKNTIVPFPKGATGVTSTVGKYLLDRLHQLGVNHIFGIPGDYIIRFDKLIEEHPIKMINTTRENTAGYMADAYARMQGIGAACITYGVGINIINATAQAYVESTPIVIISGAASRQEFINNQYLHHLINTTASNERDLTQLEIFKQATIDQTILDNPKTCADEIDRVLDACVYHKKPVYIELPRDIVDQPISSHQVRTFPRKKSDPTALSEAIEETKQLLSNAEQPLLWLGRDVAMHGFRDEILSFAEKHSIPIVSTFLAKTIIDERHPLFIGVYQGDLSRKDVKDYVHSSDVVLMLGVLRSDVNTGFSTTHINEDKCVIASPRRVAIAHHEYPKAVFQDFLAELSKTNLSRTFSNDFPANVKRDLRFTPKEGKKITTRSLLAVLQNRIRPDDVLVTDIGDCFFGSVDLVLGKHAYLASAYFATMGYGIPGAIGAQVATPEKRVIALIGDGGFQMTAMELSTAVRYRLDPIIILFNNHGYGTERPLLEGEYNEIQNWEYTMIPKLLGGGKGDKVTTEDGFDDALEKALLKRGEFTVIEVELDKTDYSPALQRFKGKAKDTV